MAILTLLTACTDQAEVTESGLPGATGAAAKPNTDEQVCRTIRDAPEVSRLSRTLPAALLGDEAARAAVNAAAAKLRAAGQESSAQLRGALDAVAAALDEVSTTSPSSGSVDVAQRALTALDRQVAVTCS